MFGENCGDPRHGRERKKYGMQKSAAESNSRPCAEQHDEEDADGNPRINTEIEAGVGKRKRRPGQRAKNQAERCRCGRCRSRTEEIRPRGIAALVLHDGLKAGALEAFLRGFGGFLIRVGPDLNMEIFVGLRCHDECRKFFLLQRGGDGVGIRLRDAMPLPAQCNCLRWVAWEILPLHWRCAKNFCYLKPRVLLKANSPARTARCRQARSCQRCKSPNRNLAASLLPEKVPVQMKKQAPAQRIYLYCVSWRVRILGR